MNQAFICDAIRTPFGRFGGALSSVRTDDLGAVPIRALMARNPQVDWEAVADVIYGCANPAIVESCTRIPEAGFVDIITIYKWVNFQGWLAIK